MDWLPSLQHWETASNIYQFYSRKMFLAKHFLKYQVCLNCFVRNFGTYYAGIHSVYKHQLAGVILLTRTVWLKSQQVQYLYRKVHCRSTILKAAKHVGP
jgi:hypothetical protein